MKINQILGEGADEHGQKRLWAQITDYEKRAKATSNDIKKQHLLKMADELRGKLKTSELNEFAPGAGDDNGDNDDSLFRFAKMWYSAPDVATQRRVEQALAKIGWEIGELESEEGGAFVMRIGDDAGDSYIGWSEEQLAGLDESQLNEYLVKAGMPVKDVLALNLFQDFDPVEGAAAQFAEFAEEPMWQQVVRKYAPIANMLKKKLLATKRPLTDAEAEAVEQTWYDGSDAYDDMEIEYLVDIYDQQIDTLEALLAGNLTDEEFGEGVAEGGIPNLRKYGQEVPSTEAAIDAFSNGDRVFLFPEMDNAPFEAPDIETIANYSPEQILVVPSQGIAEAPGAETLAHNQSTVASNEKAFDLEEGKDKKPEQPEADYGDDYQAMVSRVKKLAGLGPLKTVYDPAKRVYKNVPTAVQPKK